jgi:hypothetical protein
MIDAQNLVRISQDGDGFFVYETDVPVNPVAVTNPFILGELGDVVGLINSINWPLTPNAYTRRTTAEEPIFQLYSFPAVEYARVLDIQNRRIREELLT